MVSQMDDNLLYEPMHLPVTQDSDLAITNFIYPSTSNAVSMIDLSLTEEAFSPVADQVVMQSTLQLLNMSSCM